MLTYLIATLIGGALIFTPQGRRARQIARGWVDGALERMESPERALARLSSDLERQYRDAEAGYRLACGAEGEMAQRMHDAYTRADQWREAAERAMTDDEGLALDAARRAIEAQREGDGIRDGLIEVQRATAQMLEQIEALRVQKSAAQGRLAQLSAQSRVARARARIAGYATSSEEGDLAARVRRATYEASAMERLGPPRPDELDARRTDSQARALLAEMRDRPRLGAGGDS